MSILRAQIVLKHVSGLAEDVATNTLYFLTSIGTDDTQMPLIAQAISDFFNVQPAGGSNAMASFFSNEMAQNGHEVKFYRMSDPEPRVPIGVFPFNFAFAINGDPLPGEVALCLSFQGEKVSGLPQARRRGRIYVGRLDKDCSTSGRPSSALVTNLKSAGAALLAASDAAPDWSWHVYSPTQQQTSGGWLSTAVENGWVDNAFDTQRRRGLAPTSRTLWP